MLDATRIRDRAKVVLKRVLNMGDEIRIALNLSSSRMRSDPRNRAVPVLDVIPIHNQTEEVLLVTPYLHRFDSPPFHCQAEFIEAVRQFLEVRSGDSNDCLICMLTLYL